MPEVLEGSQAVARAIALARPQVVAAYPISPQTHIVEALSGMVRTGDLLNCDYVNVDSEFSAMSASIGASAAGVRTYTATASQGLLYMVEAMYNASGLGLPIVMTVANRAIGAPINIWNDHSDSLSQRDSGWLQLFAADNQEALDLHIQAYKIGEQLSVPVMVCMDGFVLTHASDIVDIPTQEQVDEFLPPFVPRQKLDLDNPITIGMMSGPDTFTEVRYNQHQQMVEAVDVVAEVGAEFAEKFGRNSGGLCKYFGREAEPEDLVVIAMGSVIGTLQVVVKQLQEEGYPVSLLGITSYRPWPKDAVRAAMNGAKRVVVFDRALQLGIGGILSQDVRRAVYEDGVEVHSVITGLGGRPITESLLRGAILQGLDGKLDDLTFLALDPRMKEQMAGAH